MDEEMDKMRQKIQTWKEDEFKSLVSSVVRKEVKNLVELVKTNLQKNRKKSYSEVASNKQEAIFIIKPMKENDASSSEVTKKNIKNKIDVSKLGVRITKMK